MMRIKLFICAIAFSALFNACSTDFELTTDWKDIPIVYGLLDLSEDVHYLRIEKAFIDPETSALDISQIADSIYYDNLDVRLRKGSNEFQLQEVNAEEEGLIREEGPFARTPNILYKIIADEIGLEAGDQVELIINRGDNLPVVTATTTILGESEPRTALSNGVIGFNSPAGTTLQWRPAENATFFDLRMILRYDEYPTDNPSASESKTIEWVIDKEIPRGSSTLVFLSGDDAIQGDLFYTQVSGSIEEDPNISRIFQGIDVIITGGGEALDRYLEVINANTGVTSSQEIPNFTNLSEGRGVFSSRHKLVIPNVQINASTRDSLRNGRFTKDLNFF